MSNKVKVLALTDFSGKVRDIQLDLVLEKKYDLDPEIAMMLAGSGVVQIVSGPAVKVVNKPNTVRKTIKIIVDNE